MPKKMHPADVADRAAIATATEFSAFLRLGPHDKIVERRERLADAAAAAVDLRAKHPGRDVVVYAILPTGVSIPVPKDMQAGEEPKKGFAKRFNAQRAARKLFGAAAKEGDTFRTFQRDGAWDFEAVVVEPEYAAPKPTKGKRAAIEDAARRGYSASRAARDTAFGLGELVAGAGFEPATSWL